MNVFELFASLTLDTSEYDNSLDNAEQKTESFGSKLGKGLGVAASVGATAITAVGTATVAMTGAMVKGVQSTAEYGDNIDKMSQKMGLTAEAYQEWDAVMQHSGTTMETMKASMKTLANAVESGNEAFERIGLTQEQLAEMSQQDIFEATIAGLQNIEDTTQRTYLAGQLLGRGATELGALLNTSAEDTQAMRDRVHELGGVMSDEAVKAAAGFQDSLQDMQTAFSGLQRGLLSEMLPSITTVMDGLGNIFAGEDELGLEQVGEGIDALLASMGNVLPKIIEIGSSIVQTLASAIVENLPKLFSLVSENLKSLADFLPGFIGELVNSLVVLIPDALQTVFDVVISLMNGLSELLPELLPTVVEMLTGLVGMILDNIDLLLDAAIGLVMALADGIMASLPILLEKAPELISKFIAVLFSAFYKLEMAGVELLMSVINGIIDCIPTLLEAVGRLIPLIIIALVDEFPMLIQVGFDALAAIIGGFVDAIPSLLANLIAGVVMLITSMSTTFVEYDWLGLGKNIIQGIIDGIGSMGGAIAQAASNMASTVMDTLKSAFGIHSPSTVMRDQVGKMLALGLGEGFEENAPDLQSAIDDMMVEPSLSLSAEGIGGIGVNLAGSLNGLQVVAPIYIGNTLLDTFVTDAITRQEYISGGR